jgi:serine/threonine-protein kinase
LGAVLFELLTGERLFAGDNEMTVLETVREGKVRAPREVNPAVPAAVNAIVVHALALEPGERFQTAGELQQRLEAELYALRPTPGHSDLAAYLQKLLEAEPPAAERAAAGAAATAASPSGAGTPTPATKTPPPARAGEVPAVVPLPGAAPGHVPAVLEERGGRGRTLLIAAIVAVAIVGALVTFLVLRSRGAAGAAAPGAAQAARTAPVKPGPAAAAPQAAGPAAAPASSGVNVDQIVNQELARKEEALRQKAEEDKKRIQRELEAAKAAAAAKAQAAAEERQAAVVEPAVLAPPQTAAPEPAPEPAVQRAEPARQEPAPAEPAPHAPAAPQTRAGDLVRLGPGVTPPQLVSYDKPRYPPLAQQLRVEGVVVISLLVDENGHVQEARVAEPIRQKVGINEAALAAARTARYRPATKDGVPVKVWTRLRIPFKL